MILRLFNPIIFCAVMVLLGWLQRAFMLDLETASWLPSLLLSLVVIAFVVNLALIVLRMLSKRTMTAFLAWCAVFFAIGCYLLTALKSTILISGVDRDVDLESYSYEPAVMDQKDLAFAFFQEVLDGKRAAVKERIPRDFAADSAVSRMAAYFAIVYRRPLLLEALLDAGVPPDSQVQGQALLLLAVEDSRLRDVEILLKADANANVRDAEGNTPLMRATLIENEEMMKLLVKAGASIDAQNLQGEKASDFTRKGDLLKILKK